MSAGLPPPRIWDSGTLGAQADCVLSPSGTPCPATHAWRLGSSWAESGCRGATPCLTLTQWLWPRWCPGVHVPGSHLSSQFLGLSFSLSC